MSADFREFAEWDWVVSPTGEVLHALASLDDEEQCERDWGGAGRSVCGLYSDWWSIPGIFTRMGAMRCKRCCTVLRYPQGQGSPKNDDKCRPLVEARIGQINAN